MAFADLREFVAHLEKTGQLRRISAPVSRDLEITEITDRVSKGPAEGNQALLFENVEGFSMPVLINAFGTAPRMAARTLAKRRLSRLPQMLRWVPSTPLGCPVVPEV